MFRCCHPKTLPHFENYISILAPLSHLLSILRLASFSKLQVSQCSFEKSKLMHIISQNLKNSFLISKLCHLRDEKGHCSTSRKDEGSNPDGVIGIFHWHNLSGRTMVLRSTQPLTEMSTKNISWGLKPTSA